MNVMSSSPATPVRTERAGVAGLLVLLAVLVPACELGPAGLAAGAAYGAVLMELLVRALRRHRRAAGPADLVTLARAVLVGGVTALVADGLVSGAPAIVTITGLTVAALVLDGVDGQVARRTNTVTPLGARFDMEVDAFLVLVLSVLVATVVGPWALAVGLMRYAFVAAGAALPWLRGSLPPSMAAKTVAALQGVVLIVVGTGLLPLPAATAAVAVALAALTWSFARSVRQLWAGRRVTTPTT